MAIKKGSKRKAAKPAKAVPKRPVGRPPRITEFDYENFLNLLTNGSHPLQAAEMAGMSLQRVWERRRDDPEFAARYKVADNSFTDHLEARAVRMATECDGAKPTMLIFMLNARRPEVYRPQIGVKGTIVHSFAEEFGAAMQNLYNVGDPTSSQNKH